MRRASTQAHALNNCLCARLISEQVDVIFGRSSVLHLGRGQNVRATAQIALDIVHRCMLFKRNKSGLQGASIPVGKHVVLLRSCADPRVPLRPVVVIMRRDLQTAGRAIIPYSENCAPPYYGTAVQYSTPWRAIFGVIEHAELQQRSALQGPTGPPPSVAACRVIGGSSPRGRDVGSSDALASSSFTSEPSPTRRSRPGNPPPPR